MAQEAKYSIESHSDSRCLESFSVKLIIIKKKHQKILQFKIRMSNVNCRADLLLMVMMTVSAVCGVAWHWLGCCPACRLRTSAWDGECGGRVWPSVNGKQTLRQAWMSSEWGENEEAQRPAETLQLEHPPVISHVHIQYCTVHTRLWFVKKC